MEKFYCSKMCKYFPLLLRNQVRCFSFVFCIPLVLKVSIIMTCHCHFLTARLYASKHVDGSVILCPKCQMVTRYGWGVHCLFWKVISPGNCQQLLFPKYGALFCVQLKSASNPKGDSKLSFSSILFFNVRAFASIAIEKKKKRRRKKFI